jgi:hypothetical protein
MSSLNRSIIASALTGLSLALLAGCKTGEPHPEPTAVPAPPIVATNKPAPPKVNVPSDSSDTMAPNILEWDAVSKEYLANPGEKSAPFSFSLTNVSPRAVIIYDTSTSCDCTVASLPSKPWTIPSGGTGRIEASINLSNKVGVVTNYVIVFTSQGNRRLNVKAILPDDK